MPHYMLISRTTQRSYLFFSSEKEVLHGTVEAGSLKDAAEKLGGKCGPYAPSGIAWIDLNRAVCRDFIPGPKTRTMLRAAYRRPSYTIRPDAVLVEAAEMLRRSNEELAERTQCLLEEAFTDASRRWYLVSAPPLPDA